MVQRWIYVSIMRCNDTNKIFFKIIVGKNMNIEPCPKCKSTKGYDWTWSKNIMGLIYRVIYILNDII